MAPEAPYAVECDMHGPMRWRPGLYWWECLGFDGEGPRDCGVMILYEEDVKRGTDSGIPGVSIR